MISYPEYKGKLIKMVDEYPIYDREDDHVVIGYTEIGDMAVQKRGGVGTKIKFTNKNDYIWRTVSGKTTDKIIIFTNKGQNYTLSLSNFPIGEEIYINQLLNFKEFEYITNILTFDKAKKYKYVVFATKNGPAFRQDHRKSPVIPEIGIFRSCRSLCTVFKDHFIALDFSTLFFGLQ